MSPNEKTVGTIANDKDALRIVLDSEATRAVYEMTARLKAVGSYVKFYPSQLVSGIVSEFFEAHFEKDMDKLVSKFFDAKAYISSEVQRAQNADEAVQILKGLSESIDKIKGKERASGRSKGRPRGGIRSKKKDENAHEKDMV